MVDEGKLKFWLSKYQNPDIVIREVITATKFYPALLPGVEDYTFNDGTGKQLVNLNGTIPVMFRNMLYNIPVCIWLIDTHPTNAPICYVKPTTNMSIHASMYVDRSGKVYLPYLSDWVPNSSELLGLIQVMIVTFSELPPVFAKPKDELPYPSYNSYMPSFPSTPSNFGYSPYPQTSNSNSAITGCGTIKEEHIRKSLITAVEEKVLRRMKEMFQQNEAELETLKRTQEELKQGKIRLESIIRKLDEEKTALDRNVSLLKDKQKELDHALEKIGDQESIDVDDAVTTTAPLYKQLLNAFAEEAALEDAIYNMGEALRHGVIDLDLFLKQVRTLSRKQFMLKATMQKCRLKAGLAL